MSSPSPSPPKQSPKQSSRPSPKHSPKRRPLHERTKSQTNEQLSTSLRMIEDPEGRIYSTSPYPTKPAHILSPQNGQGYVFDEENNVSDDKGLGDATPPVGHPGQSDRKGKGRRPDNAPELSPIAQNTEPSASYPRLQAEESQAYIPASSRHLQDVLEESETSSGRPSDEVIVLPDVPRPEESIRTLNDTPDHSPQPSPRPEDLSSSPNFVTINQSSSSLASSNSRGTVRRHSSRGGHWTFSPFPPSDRPTSSTSDLSSSRPLNAVPEDSIQSSSPSVSSREASSNVGGSSPNFVVHYPVVRPPSSSSGSWAESTLTIPKLTSRMVERGSPKWNPHLSTVPSERSEEKRHERSGGSQSRPSSMTVEDPSEPPSPQLPQPIYLKNQKRAVPRTDMYDEAERAERGDSVTDLRSPYLRTKNSGFLSLWSSESRRNSLTSVQERPGSSRSMMSNAIPTWARSAPNEFSFTSLANQQYHVRAYYSRGANESLGAPSSTVSRSSSLRRTDSPATDHFPLSIFRPRTPKTPGGGRPLPPRPDSLVIEPSREESVGEIEVAQAIRRPIRSYSRPQWSPHLHPDRRSANPRRSTWKAPSLDEEAEVLFSRRNAQVGLFAIGFVFPLAWLIAAFLPLPPKPVQFGSKEARGPLTDVERAFDHRIGPIDEVRYENARWWRQINRSMAIVGVVLVATVVTLSVVATR